MSQSGLQKGPLLTNARNQRKINSISKGFDLYGWVEE